MSECSICTNNKVKAWFCICSSSFWRSNCNPHHRWQIFFIASRLPTASETAHLVVNTSKFKWIQLAASCVFLCSVFPFVPQFTSCSLLSSLPVLFWGISPHAYFVVFISCFTSCLSHLRSFVIYSLSISTSAFQLFLVGSFDAVSFHILEFFPALISATPARCSSCSSVGLSDHAALLTPKEFQVAP